MYRLPPLRFALGLLALTFGSSCVSSRAISSGSTIAGDRPPYTPAQLAGAVTCSELALAPDGSELAVVTDRFGALELWTLSRSGTGTGTEAGTGTGTGTGTSRGTGTGTGMSTNELTQRTRAGESIAWPSYSPDGASLIFAMDHGGDERYDLWILRRGSADPEPLIESSSSEIEARFSPDGRHIAYLADVDREFRFNLWLLEVATGERRQLTREEVSVTAPRFSRDGKTLVVTRTPDDQQGDLLEIDVATGATRAIPAPHPGGIIRPVGFLPDGRLVALATNGRGFLQLALVTLAGGTVEPVGPDDWDVEEAAVAADGAVVYSRNVHGESELSIAAGPVPFAGAVRPLFTGGEVNGLALDRTGKTVLVLRETSNRPAEVVAVDPASGSTRPVVPAETGGVRSDWLARSERIGVSSFDGRSIDVFVWTPPVARLGSPPPAVVMVHGGPDSQTRAGFDPWAQTLAEAGFVVLSPNYRGSSGYGQAFLDLNNKDWGGGDLKDLLASIDALAARGAIDPERVAIMGASYGGYMALRAITAEPERWRAAIDLYGMPDLIEDYRITEDRYGPWYRTEMGDPVKDEALFRERSPIHALDRIRVPLLVFQGANDSDVPKAESDLVVGRLKERGMAVEYVVYPNEGHGFTRRENRTDMLERTVGFLVRHLAPEKNRAAVVDSG